MPEPYEPKLKWTIFGHIISVYNISYDKQTENKEPVLKLWTDIHCAKLQKTLTALKKPCKEADDAIIEWVKNWENEQRDLTSKFHLLRR